MSLNNKVSADNITLEFVNGRTCIDVELDQYMQMCDVVTNVGTYYFWCGIVHKESHGLEFYIEDYANEHDNFRKEIIFDDDDDEKCNLIKSLDDYAQMKMDARVEHLKRVFDSLYKCLDDDDMPANFIRTSIVKRKMESLMYKMETCIIVN
jgi:hypothetical protein